MAVTADGQVVVELVLDADRTVRGVRTANGEVLKFERSADRAGGALQRMGGWLKGLVAGAVVAQLGRIASGLYEIATAAEETESKFRTVFGSAASEMEAFGQRTAHVAGQTLTEFRGMSSQVGAILQSLGLSQQQVVEQTQGIMSLAADLASFHNTTIEEAFGAIRSGLVGEQEPLKRYGIVLREAMVTGSTEAEKAMSRLEIITRNAGVAVGDLARTQDSASNQGRRLAAVTREARDAFAKELLGAIQDTQARLVAMVGSGEGFIQWAQDAGRAMRDLIRTATDFADAFADLGREIGGAETNLFDIGARLRSVNSGFRMLLAPINAVTDGLRYLKIAVGETAEVLGRLTGLPGVLKWGHDLANGARAALNETTQLGKGAGEAATGLDKLTESLGGGGGGGGAAGATDKFKTAIERAREEVADLQRNLEDLNATSPETLAALRAEAMVLDSQIRRYERLVDIQARFLAARKGVGVEALGARNVPRSAAEGMAEAARPEGLTVPVRDFLGKINSEEQLETLLDDVRTVEGVPEAMEGSFVRAEEGIAGTLNRISGLINNFAHENKGAFEDMAAGIDVTLGNLGSMAADFFEASGRESEKAFRWQKRIATAQAIVSTLTAANNALADVRPFPLNLAAAAAILAAGYARVRAINAQQIGGGTGGGAGAGVASVAPSGVSNLAAGLALQGGGRGAVQVNVAPPAVTNNVSVHGVGMDGLIERIETRQDVRQKALGNQRGLG